MCLSMEGRNLGMQTQSWHRSTMHINEMMSASLAAIPWMQFFQHSTTGHFHENRENGLKFYLLNFKEILVFFVGHNVKV